ncbi:MAG: hypothetical protein ABL963_00605 [Longimicrobiales bacterium]
MIRRIRALSGLVLLAALLLSLGEGIAAATCDPEMSQPDPVAEAGDDGMGAMPMDHPCPPGHQHDAPNERQSGAPCPFGLPGAAQGCNVFASVPAAVALPELYAPKGAALAARLEVSSPLLRTSSIFRPPKA